MRHRGPDGEGYYRNGGVALGHRRLSIVDIAGGRQPISNEDDTLILVCNGEIYNSPALRKQLLEAGHTFKTATDVEVILHLYEEHGAACVPMLRGMFAFAIWDTRTRTLFMARRAEQPTVSVDVRRQLVADELDPVDLLMPVHRRDPGDGLVAVRELEGAELRGARPKRARWRATYPSAIRAGSLTLGRVRVEPSRARDEPRRPGHVVDLDDPVGPEALEQASGRAIRLRAAVGRAPAPGSSRTSSGGRSGSGRASSAGSPSSGSARVPPSSAIASARSSMLGAARWPERCRRSARRS